MNNPKIYLSSPHMGTSELDWHEDPFNPQGWMVDAVLKEVARREMGGN